MSLKGNIIQHSLISVIVAVYNVEKYLPYCLNSIIEQTYTNLEIILVDDGSTDNSGKICDDYAKKDKRIKVIHQQNYGVSYTRNIGLKYARGEFITFMDSDDILFADVYLEGIKFIHKYNVDIVKWKFASDKPLNTYIGEDIKLSAIQMSKLCLENILDNSVSNCLFKNDIICNNKINFNCNIKQGEDLLFLLHYLSYINECYVINKVYYYYTQRNDSATKKYNYNYINDIQTLISILNDFTNNKKYLRQNFYNRVVLLAFYVLLMEDRSKEKIKIKIANIKSFFNYIEKFLKKSDYNNISIFKRLPVLLTKKGFFYTSYILTKIMIYLHILNRQLFNKLIGSIQYERK